MTSRISVLVPTRRRAQQFTRLVRSIHETASDDVEIVAYLDDDDPTRHSVYQRCSDVTFVEGPRRLLSETWNECARVATGDILMQCGDDVVFRTSAWDDVVRYTFDEIPDKIAVVYGRDGMQDENLATHGFVHRRWVDTVGYFLPPYFSSDYNDLWLTEVARQLDRLVYVPTVYTEHMHFLAGKGKLDRTHRERLQRHERDQCDAIWEDTHLQRRHDVLKLREVIDRGA